MNAKSQPIKQQPPPRAERTRRVEIAMLAELVERYPREAMRLIERRKEFVLTNARA